ncbi:MAG TPA: lipopolysaccharide transport periplasmic protein LptA [Gammaproteobacteria bacterium]|nr:lipopolysaccharide transport periplasmic protein LptA [Gammaproteobacteria bacterium]
MHPHRNAWLCLFLSLITLPAHALQSDSQQKIHITADTTTYNFKNGITTFTGHVIANQGTTHLTAEKLITKADNKHQIQEVIAYGQDKTQAHYLTLPRPNEAVLHAIGDVIHYFPITANVTLQNHVTVQQGENSFQGELILYNMNEQTITVPPTPRGRAVLVYNQD